MPTLWLHDTETPGGCLIVKTKDGRVDIWEPSRPFALSPSSYYAQPYPRRPADLSGLVSILRETAEKKEREK